MSNPSAARESTDEQYSDERTLEEAVPSLAQSIRVTGFWGAILLPIGYLPLLAMGLSSSLELGLFVGLVALNLVALYVGHAHRRD